MNDILNPNCSEEVFRLTGTLDEIKSEVLKMLDIIEDEYIDEGYKQKGELDYKRNEIKNIKSLDEFRDVIFPFTCNHETYFKPRKSGDLDVATCNNHDWTGIDKLNMFSQDDYRKIAGYEYYTIKIRGRNWVYIEKEYDYDSFPSYPNKLILETADLRYLPIKKKSYMPEMDMRLRIEKGKYYFLDDKAIELREVKDKKKLERIEDKIMVMKI